MDAATVIGLIKQMFLTTLSVAGPVLIAGLVVGLLVSVFQAVTSIQEQTMTMVPKMLVVVGVLLYTMPWIIRNLVQFTRPLLGDLSRFVR